MAVLIITPTMVQIKPANAKPPDVCTNKMGEMVGGLVASTVYKTPIPVSVYLPPCYEVMKAPLPVVYLLHGANADETQWPDLRVQISANTVISETGQPFIVVMPGGSYRNNLNYASFVLKDLLPAIEKRFNARATRCGRAIGGLSMGGYWALKIAFQHPDLFSSVGGHSPVVSNIGADDPLDLVQTAKGLDRLSVILDVGKSDWLKYGTIQLGGALKSRSIPVTLTLNPGGHSRPYWRAHSEEYLRFYAAGFDSSLGPSQTGKSSASNSCGTWLKR